MSDRARKRRLISRAGAGEKQHPPNTPAASQDDAAKNFAYFLERNPPPKNFPKEMLDAIRAARVWTPQGIESFMDIRTGEVVGLQEMLKELRFYVEKLDVSNERILADGLLCLIRAMVERLNWLAETDKLGDAPRSHETWPINYAPDAGKGASKWQAANELYQKLGCGKDAVVPRIPSPMNYQATWTELAEIGVHAALLAKHKAASVDKKVRGAKLRGSDKFKFGRRTLITDFYLCPDGLQQSVKPASGSLSRDTTDGPLTDNQ